MVIETIVAAAFTSYFVVVLINYRGIMDLFLRQMERNRRAMRSLVLARTPEHRDWPYPPNVKHVRRWWPVVMSIVVVSGATFIIVRCIQLIVALQEGQF
jgi:hypothetical protein